MEHGSHNVDILDKTGAIVASKRRIDVDKQRDIYHTIHVILVTPRGEVVLSTIPVREDLPNIYARRLGTTVATIRRSDETAEEAAERSVGRELFIDHISLTWLGESMYYLPDKRFNYISVYYGVGEAPESYSLLDIEELVVITPKDLDYIIERQPDKVAETLKVIWRDYRRKLPL